MGSPAASAKWPRCKDGSRSQKIPDSGTLGIPNSVSVRGGEEVVLEAIARIEHEHVAVAGVWISLDGSVSRNRHRRKVALVRISSDDDVVFLLRRIDNDVGDTDLSAIPCASAEVSMHFCRGADRSDHGSGGGIDCGGGDVLVPGVFCCVEKPKPLRLAPCPRPIASHPPVAVTVGAR